MRMCKSYRIALFSKLAPALVAEGKNEKALNVLDKAMEVLPPEMFRWIIASFFR